MSTTTAFVSVTPRRATRTALERWMTHGTIVLADLVGLSVAGILAVVIRHAFHAHYALSDYWRFAPSVVVFFVIFAFSGLYPGIATSPIEEFRLILRASTISFLVLTSSTFFLREGFLYSRGVFFLAWLFTIVAVPLSRRLMRGRCSRQPWWGIPTVIVGEHTAGLMMLELLKGHHRVGLRPVALLVEHAEDNPRLPKFGNNIFVGDLAHAHDLAEQYRDCYAVLAMPNASSDRIRAVFTEHAQQYRRLLIIPDLFGMKSLSVTAKDICGVLALQVDQNLEMVFPQCVKRCFDLAVSVLIALLISPLLLLLCLGVRFSSPGPIFYGQRRIGKDRVPFHVWKFRSMVVDADSVLRSHLEANPALREEWERDHKLKNDPRVTWIGRLLRKSSLDELPQIWNVIRGQMSLVGPRPITDAEVERYGKTFVQYLRVIPGVTGLWQVSGRNDTTYDLRTRIDDYYIRNWSLSLDVYILLRTLKTIFLSEGAY